MLFTLVSCMYHFTHGPEVLMKFNPVCECVAKESFFWETESEFTNGGWSRSRFQDEYMLEVSEEIRAHNPNPKSELAFGETKTKLKDDLKDGFKVRQCF